MVNEKKQNKSGFSKFINIFGSIVLVVMFTLVAFNFINDGRVFEKSLLSNETNKAVKDSGTGTDASFKTIKYNKTTDDKSSSGSKSSSSDKSKSKSGTSKNESGSSSTAGTGSIPPSNP